MNFGENVLVIKQNNVGYRDTRLQGYKGTRVQGYKGTGVQGYKVAGLQGKLSWLRLTGIEDKNKTDGN